MNKLIVFLVLLPSIALGGWGQQELPPIDKTYVCGAYTINDVSPEEGFLTDRPIRRALTTIKQSNTEFKIVEGFLFPDEQVLENPVGGTLTGFGMNGGYLFFKRRNLHDDVYFMIYEFDNVLEGHEQDRIDRLITIAQCVEQ